MELTQKPWWNYLDEDLQELMLQGFDLLRVSQSLEHYHDYSFVVFPASKAYEGFLKKFFLDMGFISKEEFEGTRFRIGKALNPSLDKQSRDDRWVYAKLEKYCNGAALPNLLWDTWKECRNLVFHWFPREARAISHDEARSKLLKVVYAIDEVFKECAVPWDKKKK